MERSELADQRAHVTIEGPKMQFVAKDDWDENIMGPKFETPFVKEGIQGQVLTGYGLQPKSKVHTRRFVTHNFFK